MPETRFARSALDSRTHEPGVERVGHKVNRRSPSCVWVQWSVYRADPSFEWCGMQIEILSKTSFIGGADIVCGVHSDRYAHRKKRDIEAIDLSLLRCNCSCLSYRNAYKNIVKVYFYME